MQRESAWRGVGELHIEVLKQRGQIQSGVGGCPGGKAWTGTAIEIQGTSTIAMSKVMVGGGDLDQALQQTSRWPLDVMPQRFPNFVALKIRARVEARDALQQPGLVGRNLIVSGGATHRGARVKASQPG